MVVAQLWAKVHLELVSQALDGRALELATRILMSSSLADAKKEALKRAFSEFFVIKLVGHAERLLHSFKLKMHSKLEP